jgi:hypothetical protein
MGSAYEKFLKNKDSQGMAFNEDDMSQMSVKEDGSTGGAEEGATGGNKLISAMAKGASNNQSSKGNAASDIGGALMTGGALMEVPSPWTMAAGAALKVIGGVQAKKEKAAQVAANNENNRRTKLMSALGQLGQGVGSIGMS